MSIRILKEKMMWTKDYRIKRKQPLCDFPGSPDDKESACSTGDPGLIPGSGEFPG